MSQTINHAVLVDRFYAALISGQIQGVKAQPALTLDVHRLYRAWASNENVPPLDSPSHLARFLIDRHSVATARKRYAMGAFIQGPHSVLYIGGPQRAGRGRDLDLLGESVCAFQSQVERFTRVVLEQSEQVRERV